MILPVGFLLIAGAARFLGAQTANVSVWSSKMDHSMETVLVFQLQSSEPAQANIDVYDDIPRQQIAGFNVAASSGFAAQTPGASPGSATPAAEPTMDQEAESLIIRPLQAGAETISSAPGSAVDFLLVMQLARAVKSRAYRIETGVTGSDDLDSVAFRNPDGTYVLFTVNHSESPASLEVFWKDRLFTYTQPGSSIALFDWDPKTQLVSLVPSEPRISAKGEGSVSIEAKCSNPSSLGIDLRCVSQIFSCAIFPVRFSCSSSQKSVKLSVTVYPADENGSNKMKSGFITITAAPDVGASTNLRLPCCRAAQ